MVRTDWAVTEATRRARAANEDFMANKRICKGEEEEEKE